MKSLAILLLIFLVGCSGKGPKTAVNTSFIFTDALTATQSQTGGIILYGRNKADSSDSFITVINGDAQQLSLANGDWEFKAVSWDGYNSSLQTSGNPMEGAVRCSYIPSLALRGTDTDLNLVLSTANCSNSDFGSSDTQGANGPKPAKFYSCTNDDAFNDNGNKDDPIKCYNSIGNSFQVVLMGRLPDGAMKEVYASRCIANDNSTTKTMGILDSNNPHDLRLPIFFPDYPGPVWSVKVFEDTGCTKQNSQSTFVHPYANTIEGRKAVFKSDQILQENEFIVYTPVCGSLPGTGATPFVSHLNYTDQGGTNVSQSYNVICTPDQMASFMTNNLGLNYKLGQNIDFAGATFTDAIVNGTLLGSFLGSGKTISNFTISATSAIGNGLFFGIDGTNATVATPVGISDLNVDGVTISCSSGGSNVGTVVGQFMTGANLSNIDVSNVSITNMGCSKVGGIAGSGSGGGKAKDISIDNLVLDIVSGTSISSQGGGFGALTNVSLTNSHFSNITINQNFTPSPNNSKYGGVVGQVTSSLELSDISANAIHLGSATQAIDGVTAIGGAFGNVGGVSDIHNIEVIGNIYTGSSSTKTGGVIGDATNNPATSGIFNLLSSSTIVAQGDIAGGIIGFSDSNNFALNLRSFGSLSCISNCGGVVGHANGGTGYSLLYSNMNISPSIIGGSASNIGGIFGFATSASGAFYNRAIQNDGTIDFTNTNSAVRIGGAIGYYTGTTPYAIDTVINHGSVTGNDSINGIGGIIGSINFDSSLFLSHFLNTGTITNIGAGGAFHFLGAYLTDTGVTGTYEKGGDVLYSSGTAANGAVPGILAGSPVNVNISGVDPAVVGGLTGFNATMLEGDGSSPLDLKAIYRLKQIGGQINPRLGNRQSPYIITSAAGWNMIGDLDLFMYSTFELGADLDFSSVGFTPIGSSANPFMGTLRGNGFGLNNVSINYSLSTFNPPLTGLVTIAASSDMLSGTSTLFLSEVTAGDRLDIGGKIVTVAQVVDNLNLILKKSVDTAIVSTAFKKAQERNIGIFAATKYANINSGYDQADPYNSWLYIRNPNINVTLNAVVGNTYVGALVGHMMASNSVRNIKIDGANISVATNTNVGHVGGLVGHFDLISDYDAYISNINITNSNITESGAASPSGAGGIFGYLNSSIATTGNPVHYFGSLRVYNTPVTGNQAGGIIPSVATDTNTSIQFDNLLVISDSGDSISADLGGAGGLFAESLGNVSVNNFSVAGVSISTTGTSTNAGGISGSSTGGNFKGGYVLANLVSSSSGNAGCLIGLTLPPTAPLTNTKLENSYAECGSVTGSTTPSFAVGSPLYLASVANSDVFYIGPADSNSDGKGLINITQAELYNKTFMNSTYPNFKAVDPWIWPATGHGQPLPYYEVFPQYLFQ